MSHSDDGPKSCESAGCETLTRTRVPNARSALGREPTGSVPSAANASFRGGRPHERYYPVLPVPVEQAIHHGPIEQIKDVVAEYAACGLDLLVLMPEVRSLRQLELLSEHVLPEYRH
jgi:hypothetical protein